MIDREKFIENFKPFDKEIVLEIIDIFLEEYDDRMNVIEKNIKENKLEDLRFNAHSFKGVVANFIAEEPKELSKQLEENAKQGISNNNMQLFEELKSATELLIKDLKEIRPLYE
jgi:HPt (histidine-containing phosphotransfer) domain-containing protein